MTPEEIDFWQSYCSACFIRDGYLILYRKPFGVWTACGLTAFEKHALISDADYWPTDMDRATIQVTDSKITALWMNGERMKI